MEKRFNEQILNTPLIFYYIALKDSKSNVLFTNAFIFSVILVKN